jgi:hypothetical protein
MLKFMAGSPDSTHTHGVFSSSSSLSHRLRLILSSLFGRRRRRRRRQ